MYTFPAAVQEEKYLCGDDAKEAEDWITMKKVKYSSSLFYLVILYSIIYVVPCSHTMFDGGTFWFRNFL